MVSAAWPIPFDRIRLVGKRSDFTYRLASGEDTVSLTVTGTEDDLNDARSSSASSIDVSLDVTNCDEPGTYSAVVNANLPDNISLEPGQEIEIIVEAAQDDTDTDSSE